MKITCPSCTWSTEVPDEKIPAAGGKGTCPKCQTKFEIKKETTLTSEFSFEPKTTTDDPSISSEQNYKLCQFCKERVRLDAAKCKHCGSMLNEIPPTVSTANPTFSNNIQSTEQSKTIPAICKFKVSRKSSFIGIIMPNSVIIDGKKVAVLWNGQEKELDIKPGDHTISIKQVFWIGSETIQFNNSKGQYCKFECGNNLNFMKLLILPLYGLLFRNNCIYIQQTS